MQGTRPYTRTSAPTATRCTASSSPENSAFGSTEGNNVHINLEPDTRAMTKRLFEALSSEGKVDSPLQEMFWGGTYGSVTDRFGVHWMFNCVTRT